MLAAINEERDCEDDREVISSNELKSPLPCNENTVLQVRGVLFGRSVRSTFCSLHVVPLLGGWEHEKETEEDEKGEDHADSETEEPVLVRLQFLENVNTLRSFCRRFCKLGDLIEVRTSGEPDEWQNPPSAETTSWQARRLVVDLESIPCAMSMVRSMKVGFWTMKQIQRWQVQHRVESNSSCYPTSALQPVTQPVSNKSTKNHTRQISLHSGGLEKRTQAQYVANFLIHMMTYRIQRQQSQQHVGPIDVDQWATTVPPALESVKHTLNQSDSGCLDVAGGCGYVSVALSLMGIQSTVVDPRETIGKLPHRDRKFYQRALRQQQRSIDSDSSSACCPQFSTIRAWFGEPPKNVDVSFRHPDQNTIPVLSEDVVKKAPAIVALHPDEATDAIVDAAVKWQIPFVIVPCCVFFRLFPHRQKANLEPVSTYQDLLEYLKAKHPSIQQTKLPFEGANAVLWSSF
jgi:hypothetical protein